MKSGRYALIVLLVITTAVGVSFAYREYLDLIALRRKVADNSGLQKKYEEALAQLKRLQAQLEAAHQAALAGGAGGLAEAGGSGGGPADATRRNNGPYRRAAFQALMNDPRFQALRALQQKGQLDQRYAQLFKSLLQSGVSAQQIDQLKNLLVQRQQAMQDAAQAAFQNGINPRTDRAAFQQAVNEATGEVDNQIKSALGDTGYAQYQQYQQTLPEQATVARVQQALSYTGTPLTDAQAQQLVQVLQQTAGSTANGNGGGRGFFFGGFGGPGGDNGGVAVTSQAIQQAQSILAPNQVQALQQIQQEQQAQQQLQQLLRSTFQGGRQVRPPAGATAGGG